MKKNFSKKTVRLLVLLAVAAALSVLLNIVKTKEYSNWVSTTAVITNWQTSLSKNVGHTLYFKYKVGETEYSGQDSFSGNFPQEQIGDTVTVWYDPEEVTRVTRSDLKPDAGIWPFAPFFFAVPLSLYIVFGGNRRNPKMPV